MMLPNFLNHYVILQDLVEQVCRQQRFHNFSYLLVYFAALYIRGSASFWNSRRYEIDEERGTCLNCSMSQGQEIPWNL